MRLRIWLIAHRSLNMQAPSGHAGQRPRHMLLAGVDPKALKSGV